MRKYIISEKMALEMMAWILVIVVTVTMLDLII
jgi:hypothetical protein